jgi:hypothetical protein
MRQERRKYTGEKRREERHLDAGEKEVDRRHEEINDTQKQYTGGAQGEMRCTGR